MLHASVPLGHLPAWDDARAALLLAASAHLDVDQVPTPTLLAYAGDEPLATVLLRPFGPGELTDVLVEVLALVLPVGADRVVCSVPGRAWSTDDPIPPVTPDADLRTPVVVLTCADAHGPTCTVRTSLHPYDVDEHGWSWQDDVTVEDDLEAPATAALRILLGSRDELTRDGTVDLRVAAQFARVLLLGHDVLLAPTTAGKLEIASRS